MNATLRARTRTCGAAHTERAPRCARTRHAAYGATLPYNVSTHAPRTFLRTVHARMVRAVCAPPHYNKMLLRTLPRSYARRRCGVAHAARTRARCAVPRCAFSCICVLLYANCSTALPAARVRGCSARVSRYSSAYYLCPTHTVRCDCVGARVRTTFARGRGRRRRHENNQKKAATSIEKRIK